jgi:hypothetical protein
MKSEWFLLVYDAVNIKNAEQVYFKEYFRPSSRQSQELIM